MKIWLLLIDFSMPLVMAYFFIRKGVLSIVYVPFFFFMFGMVGKSMIIPVYHMILVFLLLYYVIFNLPFFKRNIFYLILLLYFTFQLHQVEDPKNLRMVIIGLYWTFTIVALAPEICKNYTKDNILRELANAGFLILLFFIVNSIFATIFRYYPENQYGFTSGVSFGHIGIAHYNIFPLAVFVVFRKGVLERNKIFLLVCIASLFLIMLTLRRTVMALSIIACLAVMVELLNFKQIKQFVLYAIFLGIISSIVVSATGFTDQLIERIEKRNLKDRDLDEENRFIEFGLVYKDLFVYYDYDPWFGFGPLDSSGNYGKRLFKTRPLHSDFTVFTHGFGFIGLFLILSMVALCFYNAWIRCNTRGDRILFAFISLYYAVFLFTGSSKMPFSPIFLFMTLGSLYAKDSNSSPKLVT